jgi:integrase
MHLDAGTTKNGEARTFHFQNLPRVVALLSQQRELTSTLEKAQERIIKHVFHRNGEPILDFRHAWDSACKKIGLPNRLPHDPRRTAVSNLVLAGVTEKVTMQISGYKTRDVFDRYNIGSKGDLHAAAEKLAAFHDREAGVSRTVLPMAEAAGGEKIRSRASHRRVVGGSSGQAVQQGRGEGAK